MGLDIEIKRCKKHRCPNCGTVVTTEVVDEVYSNGRCWYDYLGKIGYYVPYEQRTEQNDWYGKDMTLDETGVRMLKSFTASSSALYRESISNLIEQAQIDGDDVVVNANW